MYLADEPGTDAIAKYTDELKLTESEQKALQNLTSDTGDQLNEVRKDIVRLYGREVSYTNPLAADDIRVREISGRIKDTGTRADEAALTTKTESDMDVIDSIVGGAMNRKNGTNAGMPVEAKHDVHLQIRNAQYRRETPERKAAYLRITTERAPNDSNYSVRSKWDVDVTFDVPIRKKIDVDSGKKDAQGNAIMEEKTVSDTIRLTVKRSRERNDTLTAKYEEVLTSKVEPNDHISELPPLGSSDGIDFSGPDALEMSLHTIGLKIESVGTPNQVATSNVQSSLKATITEKGEREFDRIKSLANKARASETPFRDQIAHATDLIDGITNGGYQASLKKPGEAKKLLDSVRNEEKDLRAMREKLVAYQGSSDQAISSQWSADKKGDFKDRNKEMLNRFDHMITRVEHLAEQLRRETPSLEIQYTLPDYEQRIAPSDAYAAKVRRQKIVLGTVGATGAAAGGAYMFRDEIRSLLDQSNGYEDRRYEYRNNGR